MRFNLCSACVNFQPELKTHLERIPKCCLCPKLVEFFGPDAHGFPSGIDIIHCDYFQQHPYYFGDTFVTEDMHHGVAFIDTRSRKSNDTRIVHLYNNIKNLRYVKLKT